MAIILFSPDFSLVIPIMNRHLLNEFKCLSVYKSFCLSDPTLFFFFWMLVLKGLGGLHRTVQPQLLQRYWLGHRLGLP